MAGRSVVSIMKPHLEAGDAAIPRGVIENHLEDAAPNAVPKVDLTGASVAPRDGDLAALMRDSIGKQVNGKAPTAPHCIDRGDHYFLSRPRRFGKSLPLDTIGELFAGSEPLFRGLRIHDHWDWSQTQPVLRLSFDGKNHEPGDLEGSILKQLAIIERNAGLDPAPSTDSGPLRLMDLLDTTIRSNI